MIARSFSIQTVSLRNNGGYCCLGVLAHIQGAKWCEGAPLINGKNVGAGSGGQNYLAPQVTGGMHSKTQRRLATMNDSGKPFVVIADYIEKHL